MSLLITGLAFEDKQLVDAARVAILAAALFATAIGSVIRVLGRSLRADRTDQAG